MGTGDTLICSACQGLQAFITALNDGCGSESNLSCRATHSEEAPVDVNFFFQPSAGFDFGRIFRCQNDPDEAPGLHSLYLVLLEAYRARGNQITQKAMDWLWSMRLPQCYEPVITTKQMAEQFSKGSILKNRFVVTKSLIDGTSCGASSGGFNVGVVLATEFNGNSVFAIKILPTKNYSPEVTREIGLMQPLSHPNIVRLVDAYAPRLKFELPWIAMEYCALGTLHQFLAKSHQIKLSSKKLISEAFLWQVFKDLAKAIRYCHFGEEDQDGNFGEWDPTYHRDIILGNIFLSKGGRGPLCPCPVIKLGDFGCAVSETELVHRGTRLTYLPDVCQFDWPPEGDVASVAGDVYQVGKVMYSLLTCENPDIAALQGQHWRHDDDYLDLPRARDGPHQYSAQLKGLIDRCLYRYPEGRPSSKELVKLIEPEWRNSLKMPVTLFPWFGNEGD